MKKLVIFVLLFDIAFYGFSQTDDATKELLRNTEKILNVVTQQSDSARVASIRVTTSEIGLDVFDLALLRTVDITYEYIKNSEIGLGLTVRFNFSNESSGLAEGEKYGIIPFFRYYFFNKQDYGSKGFYAETFLKLFGGKIYWYDSSSDGYGNYSETSGEKNYFEGAFGVGLGYKYVNHSGFTVDLNIGIGRALGLSKFGDSGVGRGGIVFGYRF